MDTRESEKPEMEEGITNNDISNLFKGKKKKKKNRHTVKKLDDESDKSQTKEEYMKLLDRLTKKLNEEKNVKKRVTIPRPIVLRSGTKRTMVTNFNLITSRINRNSYQSVKFISDELQSACSTTSNGGLCIV